MQHIVISAVLWERKFALTGIMALIARSTATQMIMGIIDALTMTQ